MAKKIIFSLCALLCLLSGQAQSVFYKTYGGTGYDTGYDVIQMQGDSSYFVAGSSSSPGDAPSKAMLLHVDKNGDFLNSYFYGGNRSDVAIKVMHKPGVGFWLAGYSNSFTDDANFDFYLIKLNEQFELQWQKTFGGANWEMLHDAILLPDEGVLLVGEVEGIGHQGKDGYAVRTNANGDVVWDNIYAGPDDVVLYSCALFDNSSYVVAGKWGVTESNAWVALCDFDGNYIWSKNDYLENIGSGEYRAVEIMNDRIYAFGNFYETGANAEDYRPYRAVIETNGNLHSQHFENAIKQTYVCGTQVDAEANYLVIENRNPAIVGNVDPFAAIFRFTYFLHFGGYSHEVFGAKVYAKNIIKTLDDFGRFMLVGYTKDTGIGLGGSSALLLKLDATVPHLLTVTQHQILSIDAPAHIDFNIYPNPSSGIFNFQMPNDLIINDLLLYNALGQLVLQGKNMEQLDLREYAPGLYQLQINTNKGPISARISIQ